MVRLQNLNWQPFWVVAEKIVSNNNNNPFENTLWFSYFISFLVLLHLFSFLYVCINLKNTIKNLSISAGTLGELGEIIEKPGENLGAE